LEATLELKLARDFAVLGFLLSCLLTFAVTLTVFDAVLSRLDVALDPSRTTSPEI
jgi:uncharacterized membrane protein